MTYPVLCIICLGLLCLALTDLVQDNPGEPVPKNIHPLTPILIINHPYLLSPSAMIYNILPISHSFQDLTLDRQTTDDRRGDRNRKLSHCKYASL